MNQKVKVYSAAFLFSFIVGFTFVASKVCVNSASPLPLMTYRFDISLISILVTMLFGYKLRIRGKKLKTLIANAVFYGAFMAFQAVGIQYTSTIDGGILFAIIPIIAMIIAEIFLKEKTNYKQRIFVSMSVAGVILMFVLSPGGSTSFSLIGYILLFLASACMAVSNTLTRYLRGDFSPIEICFMTSLVAVICFNGASFISSIKNGTLHLYFEPLTHVDFLVAIVYLGVAATFGTVVLMSYMTKHLETVKATIFGNLATAISIVAGVIFMGERLEVYHLICSALIVAGVLGTSISGNRAKVVPEETEEEVAEDA